MTTIRSLFAGHILALAFGLGGLLIALPHPELWAGSRFAGDVFSFGIHYAGPLHILLAAGTMLAFGIFFLGRRRTLIFFVTSVVISLAAELIGTGTGWPFGNYAYGDSLGYKILGRVPFSIPLSWFALGFSAYLLGSVLSATRFTRHRAVWSVVIGAYFLTVWDLVLDPAMAHPSMPIRFWTWFESGPYFGMPVQNFAGWTLTGVLFMAVSGLLWRGDVAVSEFPAWVPLGIYLANVGFATALSLWAGLWQPAVGALVLGAIPAIFAWRSQVGTLKSDRGAEAAEWSRASRVGMRVAARLILERRMALTVEGGDNLPRTGPVMIVIRHYHHLYDGCALLSRSSRYPHILVALDWVENRLLRRMMERLCRAAGWPVLLRADGLARHANRAAYRSSEARTYLRRALRESVEILRVGEALVVFPEGYPVIDPSFAPPRRDDDFLPFKAGFLHLIERAQHLCGPIPIVPAGLSYDGRSFRRLTMRFGTPIYLSNASDRDHVLREIEQQVKALSAPSVALEASSFQEAVQP